MPIYRLTWRSGEIEEIEGPDLESALHSIGLIHEQENLRFWIELTPRFLSKELHKLQGPLNSGRGSQVARDIAHQLLLGDFDGARETVYNKGDKFDSTPEVREWLTRYLFRDTANHPWSLAYDRDENYGKCELCLKDMGLCDCLEGWEEQINDPEFWDAYFNP